MMKCKNMTGYQCGYCSALYLSKTVADYCCEIDWYDTGERPTKKEHRFVDEPGEF